MNSSANVATKNIGVTNKNKNKVMTVVFIILSIVIFLFILQTLILTLTYDKIYDGVFLNGERVSHLSKSELDIYLENKYNKPLQSSKLLLTFQDLQWSVTPDDIDLSINKDEIINKVYAPGHEGNIFNRLKDIVSLRMNNVYIDIFNESSTLITYDKDKVDSVAEKISKEGYSEVVEHNLSVNNSNVIITAGHNGYSIPADKISSKIITALNNTDSYKINFDDITITTEPKKLDASTIAEELYIPPVDASYKKTGKEIVISSHKSGQKVDTNKLANIVSELGSNPDETFTLELQSIEPSIKKDQVKLPGFSDVLGKKTTYFSTGDKNRNYNIALSSEFINGTYLLPGEVFSFNEFVGDTTADKGYKPAGSYLNGRVVDSYGGGVCQVSTTLYNAVIDAGLEIVERSPHSLTVGYVPLGLDAAIAYPYKDLKFKNNTSEPIQIFADTTNSSCTFRILGVNNNKNRKYEFTSKVLSKTDYQVSYVNDATLAKGRTKTLQSGSVGYNVQAYRTTYIDGVKVKTEEFTKSRYSPRNKIIARGTK